MKKLFYQLLLFTFAVIGWVVYSNWPKIEAFADRAIGVGEDLAKLAKNAGVMPPTTIESGSAPADAATNESASVGTGGSQTATMYKWQDNTGRWHFGDRPPANAINVKQMSYARGANVMKPVALPEPELPPVPENIADALPGNNSPSMPTIPGIPNPKQVSELMNQVENIRDQMNARNRALGEAVDEDDSSVSTSNAKGLSSRILSN